MTENKTNKPLNGKHETGVPAGHTLLKTIMIVVVLLLMVPTTIFAGYVTFFVTCLTLAPVIKQPVMNFSSGALEPPGKVFLAISVVVMLIVVGLFMRLIYGIVKMKE